ncbi:MmgE/PrpD family protein [Bradyrhizobium sp. LHD-71]|uniref:MmgE/PrpD family protein n=1 Tax=Bradyrhizobium sp. LHD-71 TaxID=3072141 RepID=UPI00280DCDE9|nr:MmgE/PrpD family protein [Bradyrhizobium sp. LHD-71]MDQ8728194.1 MmgE/PrpD family protein [Bradyrhizobium sp. LHD-71]
MANDAAAVLADFTATFDVTRDAAFTEATLLDLIDTLACGAAGADAEGVRELLSVTRDWGGKAEAALWFTGLRMPGPAAALYNGMLSHAVEYDDTHDLGVLHAGVTVIPAVIAAAERRERLSGAELLSAIATGVEVACRLALATRIGPGVSGWLLTPLCGTFGAAAGAARALGLDAERTVHAFGLAYAQVAGNGQATIDGGLSKRMQAGFAARSGLLGAVLASAGLTGARNVFEGTRGYYKVYHRGEYDRSALVDGLGEKLAVGDLSYKPYPCCRWTHAALEAAMDLRKRGVLPEKVARIDVAVNHQAYMSTGQPLADKQRPANVVTSQFSIPYAVSLAFNQGRVGLDDFKPNAIARPHIVALAERVSVGAIDDWSASGSRGISPARVSVMMHDGQHVESEVLVPTGTGRDSGTSGLIRRKLIDCCGHGGIATAAASSLLAELDALPSTADAVPLFNRLPIVDAGRSDA